MTTEKYNGWTNYPTWRVNLEVFDGMDIRDWFDREQYPTLDLYEVAEWAKSHAETIIDDEVPESVAPAITVHGWAHAFLSEVDWHMIASHLIENASEVEA